MKLLANENFTFDSVKYLLSKGLDIKAVGTDFAGTSDKEVIELAEREGRTILTFDRDYGELIFKFGYKPSCGVIYLRIGFYDFVDPGMVIEKIISDSSFDTANKLTVFDGESLRQRKY